MRIVLLLFLALFIASCGEKHIPDETRTATNKPYKIGGQWYYPLLKAEGYDEKGIASWYGKDFHGKKTSNGEQYDMHALSAAHPTLPMGTKVRVTNLENGKSMVLRINDRGPFVKERLIDLSYAAAKEMGYAKKGTTRMRVQTVGDKAAVYVTRYTPRKTPAVVKKEREVTVTPVRGLPEVVNANERQPVIVPAAIPAAEQSINSMPPLSAVAVGNTGQRNYVQLGAFSSLENAKQLLETYVGQFPELKIFTTQGQIPVMYKVRQGPFSSRNEAEKIASRMEMAGISHLAIAKDESRPASLGFAGKIPEPVTQAVNNTQDTLVAPMMPDPAVLAPTKKAMPRAPSVIQSGRIYIQIGAFSSLQRAMLVRDRYASQYASTQVYNPQAGEADIYRVRIGPVLDVHNVGAMVDKLEATGIEKAIVVIGK